MVLLSLNYQNLEVGIPIYSHPGVGVQGNFAPFPWGWWCWKYVPIGRQMELNASSNWWSRCASIGNMARLKTCVYCVCMFLYWACIRLLSSTYFVIHFLVMHEVLGSIKGRTIMGQALKMLHLVWRVAEWNMIFGVLEKGVVLPHLQVFFTPR